MQDDDAHDPNDAPLLAGLMDLAAGGSGDAEVRWTAAEMGSIWQHQLTAPLPIDLGGSSADLTATATALCRPASIRSLADLLAHPAPPLELLQLVKDFARDKRNDRHTLYPTEAAVALYYAAIALAQVRLGQRISRLDDAGLRTGLEWMAGLGWLDPATRELVAAGLASLQPK